MVWNKVMITPPYKTENLRGDPDCKELPHIKKIVERHIKDSLLQGNKNWSYQKFYNSLYLLLCSLSNLSFYFPFIPFSIWLVEDFSLFFTNLHSIRSRETTFFSIHLIFFFMPGKVIITNFQFKFFIATIQNSRSTILGINCIRNRGGTINFFLNQSFNDCFIVFEPFFVRFQSGFFFKFRLESVKIIIFFFRFSRASV